MNDIFCDGIMEVGFVGGAVRMHLGAFRSANNDTKTKPQLQELGCIIMTPEGFVALFNGLQEVMNKFETAGMIKKQELKAENPEQIAAASVSPNFPS